MYMIEPRKIIKNLFLKNFRSLLYKKFLNNFSGYSCIVKFYIMFLIIFLMKFHSAISHVNKIMHMKLLKRISRTYCIEHI